MIQPQLLALFLMRILACIWMLRGLVSWADLVDPLTSPDDPDASIWTPQISMVLYAVSDLVGAVGLWSAAPWGGVVWLGSLLVHLVNEFMHGRTPAMIFDLACAVICAFAFWYSRRARVAEGNSVTFL